MGWVPPEDYDPISRDWYQTTVAGKGEVVIVSPYVDAQTGKVIISIGKSLSDNRNALALDLTLSGEVFARRNKVFPTLRTDIINDTP